MHHTQSLRRGARLAGPALLIAAMLVGLPVGALAQEGAGEAPFYEGMTITMLVGFGAGGGYDAYSRLAAEFLPRHIPGQPEMIVENMPGGGGRVAALNLYSAAPKDGTTIGIIVQSIALDSLTGQMETALDPRDFAFLGRLNAAVDMQYMLDPEPPVTSLDEVRETPVIVASTGPSSASSMVPRLLNEIMGTQFRVIEGYGGTAEAALAMERGEVDAIMQSVDILEINFADALEAGTVTMLWQLAIEPHPNYPDVPAIGQLGESEAESQLLRLVAGTSEIGRSFVAPPGVPEERVEILRAAFAAMIADPEFLAAAEQRQLAITPLSGEALQDLVAETMATPQEVVNRFAEITAP